VTRCFCEKNTRTDKSPKVAPKYIKTYYLTDNYVHMYLYVGCFSHQTISYIQFCILQNCVRKYGAQGQTIEILESSS
jgi:hypothetical protein